MPPVPDGGEFSPLLVDYFLCLRPDSGYRDSTGDVRYADGTGVVLGAETKVMVEPRHLTDAGGLLISSQFAIENEWVYAQPWRAHPGWQPPGAPGGWEEPWWPQRTQNERNTKASVAGVEVHNLVLTLESDSYWQLWTNIDYLRSGYLGRPASRSGFDAWMDPFRRVAATFWDSYSVGVQGWSIVSEDNNQVQQAYESVSFYVPFYDAPPIGPRSTFFPTPPPQPSRPTKATWPFTDDLLINPGMLELPPGEYPRAADWPVTERQAKILKQHVDAASRTTAMLGFNVTGANDPVTNAFNALMLERITVAFWGPDSDGDGVSDFDPSDLMPLDPDGTSGSSGIALYADAGSGTYTDLFENDVPIPVQDLEWRQMPEYVDVDGDQIADDLNGDLVLNQLDKAWVVRLTPQDPWRVPGEDGSIALFGGSGGAAPQSAPSDATAARDSSGDAQPERREVQRRLVDVAAAKAASPRIPGDPDGAGNSGDDLFMVIRTSDSLARFDKITAFVPGWLPERALHDRVAGVEFGPQDVPALQSYQALHPEEVVGQGFYEHKFLEANVACQVVDMTGGQNQVLPTSGAPTAVLGLDCSTNRGPAATLASGLTGTGGAATFSVAGAGWGPGAFVDYWLVDSGYETYQIVGNTSQQLTLLSGQPRSGPWRIVKDPSFFEQLMVEFYEEGTGQNFDILTDLLPLNINQQVSGVALYRDNDNDPANRNGVFDADIDIPVALDYPPYLVGQVGEPDTQVLFVLSSPGTDDVPLYGQPTGLANQPRRRQIVPDSLGDTLTHPDLGPDFFLVLRSAGSVGEEAEFRAAIVGWGPNTPSEPDPDTFPPPPTGQNGEFDIFSEFPWGTRAVGFITFFKDMRDYMPEADPAYYNSLRKNWVRTQANVRNQTNVITIETPIVQPTDVVITSVSHQVLPTVIPPQGVTLVIHGSGFGLAPIVTLNSVQLTIESSSATDIAAQIPPGTVLTEPVILTVTNTQNGKSGSWADFSLTTEDWSDAPTITAVSPPEGTSSSFPVTVFGTRFDNPEVLFDQTAMPLVEWTPTRIVVSFPAAGLSKTGALDVTVRNTGTNLFATKANGFVYLNLPGGFTLPIRPCFIATAAYGTPFEKRLGTFRRFRDGVLLKTAAGAALVDGYYQTSPAIADAVAQRPWLAGLVRLVLTPVAGVLEFPAALTVPVLLAGVFVLRRKPRKQPI